MDRLQQFANIKYGESRSIYRVAELYNVELIDLLKILYENKDEFNKENMGFDYPWELSLFNILRLGKLLDGEIAEYVGSILFGIYLRLNCD